MRSPPKAEAKAKSKRGRGRPKKEARAEVEDPALRQIEDEAVQHELLTEVAEVHDPHPQVGVGADFGGVDGQVGGHGWEIGGGVEDSRGSGAAIE